MTFAYRFLRSFIAYREPFIRVEKQNVQLLEQNEKSISPKPSILAADLFLNSSNYETPIDDAALCGDYVFHGLYARG